MECKKCKATFIGNWFSQKGLYSKLRKAGFTDEKAKEILPACPKCVKEIIKAGAA